MNIDIALATISQPVFFLIMALAVYSITRLINTDSFPPIEKARNWFYLRFPYDGYVTDKRPKRGVFVPVGRNYHVNIGTWLGELVSCPWCLGWWISLVATVALVASPTITLIVALPFALRVIPGIISHFVH